MHFPTSSEGTTFLIVAAQKEEKADKRDVMAKEAAEQFVKGLKNQDIESIMGVVDVPFFVGGKKSTNLIDRGQLREFLERVLAVEPPPKEHTYRATIPISSFPENSSTDQLKELFQKSLEKTDRIVFFHPPRRILATAVRFRDGQAKVVGIRSPVSPLILAMAAHERDRADKNVMRVRASALETAQRYLKAARAKELDELVKLSHIPWYADGTHIIQEREKLKQLLQSDWIDFANDARFPSQVFGLIQFGDYGELYGGERLRADQLLAKDDWIVFVGPNEKTGGFILVGTREGMTKVLGAGQ
ncbi:MAG: hypothetical protein L0Y72_13785 [Gemmataceae bacterium]|nr:hypothetical protein [Gemmataceae bacterium]MCI0740112.1 hypothetical protein [Gemmataceae bacterium]